ncbi:hypothetical protein ACIA78_34705 [Streptomyces xanthochromogenes]|uniref:hypothetical protein n=1 Tax=Streptomyces xanthochromogenes TaxID=67384 RepID=UPI00378CBDCA
MVKNGSNSSKQRTRTRMARNGEKTYLQAVKPKPPVVQLITSYPQSTWKVGALLARAWADQGLRVLLLRERNEPSLMAAWDRDRADMSEGPGPISTVLWADPNGSGLLAERCTRWWTMRGPANRLSPSSYDESPLEDAVIQARPYFDVILLLDEGEFSMIRKTADTYIAVAYSDLPRTETRTVWGENGIRTIEYLLSPQQSAAVLRDRQLRYFQHREGALSLSGVLCVAEVDPAADDNAFAEAAHADMAACGVPVLGWLWEEALTKVGHRGELAELAAPDTADGYHRAAAALLRRRTARGRRADSRAE